MTQRLTLYIAVLLGVLLVSTGLAWFLHAQGQPTAGSVVGMVGSVLLLAWVCGGLWVWRDRRWVAWLGKLIVGSGAAGLLVQFGWSFDFAGLSLLAAGVWGMGVTFMVGLVLLQLLLSARVPALPMLDGVLSVAQTMVHEAIRAKVGLVFVVIVVLVVPALPLMLAEPRLEYQVGNFLMYATMATGLMLGLMTIVLTVRSLTSELKDKQAHTNLTKPITRPAYLMGKWVGVMGLNALLLAVAGVGVYAAVRVLTVDIDATAQDALDAAAVREQVLAARVALSPREPQDGWLDRQVQQRLDELQQRDPQSYGPPGTKLTSLPQEVQGSLFEEVALRWMAVPFRGTQTYRFTGLENAARYGDAVQLRIKPKFSGGTTEDNKLQLLFRVNGRELPFLVRQHTGWAAIPLPRIADDRFHIFSIPTELITDGSITLDIQNATLDNSTQSTITFQGADAMELYYTVGSFAGNLAKAFALLWVRLMFLAMLGLLAGTFLGFPTALLFCALVYFGAAGSAFFSESLRWYATFPKDDLPWWAQLIGIPTNIWNNLSEGKIYDALKIVIRSVGELFRLVIPSFSEYNAAPMLAEGRAITWDILGRAAFTLGVLWTGGAMLIASILFSRKEVARVIV